jgi:hypothetical protein
MSVPCVLRIVYLMDGVKFLIWIEMVSVLCLADLDVCHLSSNSFEVCFGFVG